MKWPVRPHGDTLTEPGCRPADEEFRRVNGLLLEGRLADALKALEELADRSAALACALDEARAAQLAATLHRLQGNPGRANAWASRAVRASEDDPATLFRSLVELGEAELDQHHYLAAAERFRRARGVELPEPLDKGAHCALLRKEAHGLSQAGRTRKALAVLAEAEEVARSVNETGDAAQVLVEATATAQLGGYQTAARRLHEAAWLAAERAGSHAAFADLELLATTRSIEAGNLAEALGHAEVARQRALKAVLPHHYVGAALAAARIADRLGHRERAYQSLASAYVTLGDLLGKDVSRHTFEPELLRLRAAWGPDAFATVKSAYEARRRGEMAAARVPDPPSPPAL